MDKKQQLLALVQPLCGNEATALKFAAHLEDLLDLLQPAEIGDAFVQAINSGDYAAAVAACGAYYRAKPDFQIKDLSGQGKYDATVADNASRGIMREVNIDWSFPDGEVDYQFDPTAINGPCNHEWLWQFNRHNFWVDMARAYSATKSEDYAKAFRRQLIKWVAQTDIPENWNGPGSAWRTLECGLRLLRSWQVAFDSFRHSAEVEDVLLLIMISSMHRQALHLVAHPTGGNWLMMESNGLYAFAALYPELSDALENRNIATTRLLQEMEKQMLPDGMHCELSPDYHKAVFFCAYNFFNLAESVGVEKEIPTSFTNLFAHAADAMICLSTPALIQPRTNDTYTIFTDGFTKRATALLGDTPEYRYFTSHRAEGTPPVGETASRYLPYAGFAVMRSDWGADATYMCFDVGPLGTGHMHQDKLNIILFKGKDELLFDDGGGQYEQSYARGYATSGYGHNTVLVDGLAQKRNQPLRANEPIDAQWITNDIFDYAVGVYDDTFGPDLAKPATHRREVRFCKPGFFCVQDTLTATDDNPHRYEILFHMDTTIAKPLAEYENGVISQFDKTYELVMIPLDESTATPQLHIVSGGEIPNYRGWYNGRNEENLHEAVTVSRTVNGVKDYRFTTLLFPVAKGQALPQVTKTTDNTVCVDFNGNTYALDLTALNT